LRVSNIMSLIKHFQFTHREHSAGFTQDPCGSRFEHPYLLLEHIDRSKGKMLSETLRRYRDTDSERVENLTRGISRIMLSLAKKTQPCIGSLRFNDDTSITLANRPLLCTNSILESESAPKILDRTYKTCGHFIDDMLKFREEAFSAQPNAVNHEEDCHLQMLHITMLRLLKSQFVDSHSEGPFVLQLTDLHSSNIFVDDDWNVVAIIDLEFTCALPPSMINVLYWLSVDNIDDIAENMNAYNKMHKAFLDVLQSEEQKSGLENDSRLASAIEKSWTSYSSWFYRSLTSINGMAYCLEDHLYEKFNFSISREEEDQWMKLMSSFWPTDSKQFVERKLREKAKYNEDVALHFEAKSNTTSKVTRITPTTDKITS
jgi:hypothetical protein